MVRSGYLALTLIAFFAYSCKPNHPEPAADDKSDSLLSFPAPRRINMADLPDSQQPRQLWLDKAPKPLTVKIPSKAGGFYLKKLSNGDTVKVMLKPPEKKMLAVMRDEKGVPLKDRAGNTIRIGEGGNSNFTNFTSDDGLALNAITCSIMDQAGNLWFGTQGGGVSRYDGKSFTNYSTTQGLCDNLVTCLCQDKEGNFWFGTFGRGVSKYDGKTFTSFHSTSGLSDGAVQVIFEDSSGMLWFGTTLGLTRFDGKTFTIMTTKDGLPNNNVSCIAQDKAGNMWFGATTGLSKYDGKSFTNYTSADGLAGNAIYKMLAARDGSLWLGTNKGPCKYDGRAFTNFTSAQGVLNIQVQAMSEDKTGNIWYSTPAGISKFDGKSFTNYTTGQGLVENDVRCITEDKAGNIWLGTNASGLSKFTGNSFTSFTSANGLASNTVFSISQDRAGNYWFCTSDGLSKYDGKSFTNFTVSQGLARNNLYCMTQDRAGNSWIGVNSNGGMSKYDGRSFTTFTKDQGLPNNSVTQIVEDKTGNLWLATYGGLSKFDGSSFTNYTTSQGLINNFINAICFDKDGNLWVGTNEGLSRFDGKTWTNFTTAQGLANDLVISIRTDHSDNLLIGTEIGLSRLPVKELDKLKSPYSFTKGAPVPLFDNFTTAQGLPDDEIYDIAQDKKGNIFIGTNLGITVIPTAMSNLPFAEAGKHVVYYNRPNGYPVRDVNSMAMYCDSLGIIWSGTGSGLLRFDYSALHQEAGPVLAIQKIKVGGENICWFDLGSAGKLNNAADSAKAVFQESMAYGKMITPADRDSVIKKFTGIRFDSVSRFYLLPQGLELPYDKNQVTIEFNAIETSKPQQVEYQYILQGYEKAWSPVTKTTSATFGNIYEGSYTFIVKARKSSGGWSEPVTYTFKVLPPWYRSWWAYLFYGLCLIAAILVIDRIRRKVVEERLLARTREKEFAQAKEIEKAYTELKTTQAQLVQSEKMASLGELTAGIAHEIQNPLNFVNNFSEVNVELLNELKEGPLKKLPDQEKQEADDIVENISQNFQKISRHGKRAEAIVKGMLQHSRSSSGTKEPTDINTLADEYLRLSYHGLRAKDNLFSATMKTNYDPTAGSIQIIPQDISRALLNIYNNAFYAVSNKRKSADTGYEPTVSVSTKRTDGKITIAVHDNGNGVPQKVIDKIFQPFFTTKPTGEGTGLGLSMSYDIVKTHGGEIKVTTREGDFTEFLILLPV